MSRQAISKPKPAQTHRSSSHAMRAPRSDGAETRAHILRAAAQLFAAKGYERTTSKEVCEAASCNLAAVNYHFGDKAGLYAAVLVESHAQLVGLTELEEIQHLDQGPEQKLSALVGLFIRRASNPEMSWGLSVLAHEMMSPSPHTPTLIQAAVLPKVRIMKTVIAQLLDLPVQHATVQRGLAFVVLPCIMLVIAPREVLKAALPGLTERSQPLADDLTAYAMAGLQALRQRHQVGKD